MECSIRILVVDDFDAWRGLVSSVVQKEPNWQVVGEAADGLQAVSKAEELKPDLIILDIGLPKLNGIEAVRRIRKVSPESKILILSQESSADVVQEALSSGALGYEVAFYGDDAFLVNGAPRGEDGRQDAHHRSQLSQTALSG